MSFKREGDDSGLLGSLRKRRIKDLLAEDVPEDEAKLLCNGRFACLVCSHRPVFDTVNMLAVHRKGKKHAANEAIFLQKKKELQELILKRQHEQFMKDGTTKIKMAAPSAAGGIQAAQPYDPRVKKHKLKPYDRKPCLALSESEQLLLSADSPLRHGHQLKNIFQSNTPGQETSHVQPYQSKRNRQTGVSTETVSTAQSNLPVPQRMENDVDEHEDSVCGTGSVCDDRDNYWRAETVGQVHSAPAPQFQFSVNAQAYDSSDHQHFYNGTETYSMPPQQYQPPGSMTTRTLWSESEPTTSQTQANSSGQSMIGSCSSSQSAAVNSAIWNSEQTPQNVSSICDTNVGTSAESGGADGTVKTARGPAVNGGKSGQAVSAEKRKLAQQYLQLRGSGWKKDWDGKWIRDEDAEFDSDEEPPDLP